MNDYINVYKNNPTAGALDGTAVSTGDFSSPIEFVLDATQDDAQILKLAVRTESGYKTTGDVTISDQNDLNDRLKLCWTRNGTFADSISTSDEITAANKLFYARAEASTNEHPQTDRSAKFKIDCVIAAV